MNKICTNKNIQSYIKNSLIWRYWAIGSVLGEKFVDRLNWLYYYEFTNFRNKITNTKKKGGEQYDYEY